jgi:hypothetical protein
MSVKQEPARAVRRVAPPGRKAWPESLSLQEREEVKVLNPATPGTRTGPEHLALVEEGAADLAEPDMSRAYGGDERGYTDYPALADGMVRS